MPFSHEVIQGCNAQALVDAKHQIIVRAEAFSTQDHENLAPVLVGAKKKTISQANNSAQTAITIATPARLYARLRNRTPISPNSNSANGKNALPTKTDARMASIPDSRRPAKP